MRHTERFMSFITKTLLRHPGEMFCRIFLSWVLFDVFSHLDWDHEFQKSTEVKCYFNDTKSMVYSVHYVLMLV